MIIKLKLLTQEIIEVDFNGNYINELKDNISKIKNIPIENIKLIYFGKLLNDDETIEYHKIKDQCIIHCVIKDIQPNIEDIMGQNNIENNQDNTPNNNYFSLLQNNNTNNQSPINEIFSQITTPPTNILSNQEREQYQNLFGNNINGFSNLISGILSNQELRNEFLNNFLSSMNLENNEENRELYSNFLQNAFNTPQQTSNINTPQQTSNVNTPQQSTNVNIPQQTNNIFELLNSVNNLNLNNNLSREELKETYKEKIETIQNMGFDNDDIILDKLIENHGNLNVTINQLLG
tara:strand:+ start:92 stop:967 length:876 start_codon:yes stop_codon:yes gene_type:complete